MSVKDKTYSTNPLFDALEEFPEREPLGQSAFDKLKQAILRGDIPAGSRMVESPIAKAMGISRTPVREAFLKLEREGLLMKLPRGSFVVVELTEKDIEDTFGIRAVLESYAARLATIRHREEDLSRLEKKINEFKDCLDRGKMENLPEINTEFHALLYEMSDNPMLMKIINQVGDRIYRFRKILLNSTVRAPISNEDHRKMLKAMKKRDADKVQSLVMEHVLRAQKIVLNELKKNPEAFT
ncbi:MAG: GntR family transcriptional regulator [Pseudomonadota bacterium]